MAFFWYFIGCFCAVYVNTQETLIHETILSFSVTLFYPFLINLLPGVFRISSLKDKEGERKCMYKLSKILALI